MARIVLSADYSLMTDFRDLPLATFFSCIPTDYWESRFAFRSLAPNPPHQNGHAVSAPYGLRKLEAALLQSFPREEIVVAHPFHVNKFIGPETEVVGVHTMDPLGLGPVSMSFTNGGVLTPYTKACFEELMLSLPNGGNRQFKVVIGGAGTWHFDYRPEEKERLGVDHVVAGEVDHIAADIFHDIMDGSAPEKIPEPLKPPRLEEIPPIVGPSMHGMVEVMRGCGRGCQFCEVTLRRLRYFSPEYIQHEAAINVRAGHKNAWLHSDDIFLYKVEDYKTMYPNADAIKEIFEAAMAVKGIQSGNPTHGTLASVAADPDLIVDLSEILATHKTKKWIGIQSGLETGSIPLVEKIMPRKLLPYQPSEWPEVVLESIKILNDNKWYPALTAIVGLPGETSEDAYDTCVLMDQMEQVSDRPRYIVAPLSFVPIGVLRGEEFYRLDEMIDEARFNVVYRCWRKILREIDETLWSLSTMPLAMKFAINWIGRIGGRHIMTHLEKFGDRQGFKLWRNLAA